MNGWKIIKKFSLLHGIMLNMWLVCKRGKLDIKYHWKIFLSPVSGSITVEKVVRNFQNCVLYQPTLSSHLGEFQWFRLKRFSALYLINLQRHYQSVFSISKTIFEHFLREQCTRFYKSFSKHIEVTGAIEGKKKINWIDL